MPGYVKADLHKSHQSKLSWTQDSPYLWVPPEYGTNNQLIVTAEELPILADKKQNELQQIMGTFLYYACALDKNILVSINSLLTQQNNTTVETTKNLNRFLNYYATHPEAEIIFHRSRMVLYSNASYLLDPGTKSRVGGFFLFSPKPKDPTNPPK
mmetsp:Transcript_60913/g.180357  ORF Transcript_60913/g.180357 Transcript_60913/m.180357 type:complete len:155 (-) Transcript_60913:380-844(-)